MGKKPHKWTREHTVATLDKMLGLLNHDPDIIHLCELCIHPDIDIYKQLVSEWYHRYVDDPDIPKKIKKIKSILEARNYVGAAQGKLNSYIVALGLKTHYGYTDRKQVEHAGEINVTTQVAGMSQEELESFVRDCRQIEDKTDD